MFGHNDVVIAHLVFDSSGHLACGLHQDWHMSHWCDIIVVIIVIILYDIFVGEQGKMT